MNHTYKYPFDQRFVFLVENLDWEQNPWLLLLAAKSEFQQEQREELLLAICRNVYSVAEIEIFLENLSHSSLDALLEVALLEDYRSAPAIAALKVRTDSDILELVQRLLESDNAIKRALAVKIINRPQEHSFGQDGHRLLRQIKRNESDDLVIEQLTYAFSKLQINED